MSMSLVRAYNAKIARRRRSVARRGTIAKRKVAYIGKAMRGQGRNREYNVKFRIQLPYI